MADLVFELPGQVIEVAGGAGPGDHSFTFLASFPRSGHPAEVGLKLPVQTIEQLREVGKLLYTRARLVVRVEAS